MDILQIFALATMMGDVEQTRRKISGESLMSQMEYGDLIGNVTLSLLIDSGDPNLIRLAKQMKEIGKRGQEKE
ncbi:MAG: hypothetical protein UU93_C0008G0017 [Candidatus Amesbacteria bacterium GW2011_GWA2_42_12]|uniref:Uncharacterized protein n=1 Tax=Candidatus Amesbacteria bacterium GW2011_GWA2_42_12 TaxID=1618356 RepID=A0A0G0Y6A3_9BACT|nr:MAG: hypothetical protein UU93_C0008G0017 [Candidatus Amesbacteria bacterium GW2011_GWA2_42_12]